MTVPETLRGLSERVGFGLMPLHEALRDADSLRDFLEEFGWDFVAAPASLLALQPAIQLAVENATGIVHDADISLAVVLPSLVAAFNGIAALQSASDLPADFRAEFPAQLVDYLLVRQLLDNVPGWGALLQAIGVVRIEDVAAASARPEYQRYVLDRAKLIDYLQEPLATLKSTYRWGDSDFDGQGMLRSAVELAQRWGAEVYEHSPSAALVAALNAGALDPAATEHSAPRAILALERVEPGAFDVGVALFLLPETATAAPGFAVLPSGSGELGETIMLRDDTRLDIGGDLTAGLGAVVRPGQPIEAIAGGGIEIAYSVARATATSLIGNPEGTRLQVQGAVGRLEVSGTGGDVELVASIDTTGLALVIDGGDSDGFVSAALPAASTTIEFPFGASWSSKTGFAVHGGNNLAVMVPVDVGLGPVRVSGVSAALRGEHSLAQPPRVILEVGAAIRGAIGPVQFEIRGAGVELGLTLADGNLGPLDVAVGFRAPDGVGLAVAAAVVKGSGSVACDRARSEYAGSLQLDVGGIGVAAAALLTASRPGQPAAYSLVAAISAEFAPIPIGLGFTLDGVGGLIGLHRRVDTAALRAALRGPGIDNIFFADDPAAQASRLLTDLATYFPAAQGRHVFGPAAKFGWGTPTIIEGTVALLLEVPAPVRLMLLGNVSTALPTKDEPIIELNVDVLGELDFSRKTLAIDAALRDSQVAGFPITGDMALRMGWGDSPSFALSVGGFHSQFRPPPGFPELRRVRIPIGSGDNPRLDIQGFLALTSNTVQVGAAVDLYVAAGPLNIVGSLGFEALVQFVPFGFEVDLWAGVALRRGSRVLAGVHLDGKLRGPSPWHFSGEACLSLWFVDLCVGFDATFGQERPVELPQREIWPQLEAALKDVRNWTSAMRPAAARAVITAPPVDDGVPVTRIDPASALSVQQKVAPLNRLIERFAQVAPLGPVKFQIQNAKLGETVLTPGLVEDWFAPAQFEDLTDAERMSRPGYEKMVAGVTLASDAVVTVGSELIRPLEYETIKFPDPEPLLVKYRPSVMLQLAGTTRAASANAPLRHGAAGAFAPLRGTPPLVTLEGERFVIVSTLDLTPRLDITPAAGRGDVELALKTHLAANPGARDALQVVPRFEVEELLR